MVDAARGVICDLASEKIERRVAECEKVRRNDVLVGGRRGALAKSFGDDLAYEILVSVRIETEALDKAV
jgi:hypothetical protein